MRNTLPSFRGVEAFMTTASALNLRLAAGNLNISISAVSRRIKTLEEEIGVQLFVRGGRKLSLTPAGVRYREHLLPTLDIIRQATKAVGSHEPDGVTILGLPSFFFGWLSPRLHGFQSQFDNVAIDFTTLRKRKVAYSDIVIEPIFSGDAGPDMEKLFSWISTPLCQPDLLKRHDINQPGDIIRACLINPGPPVEGWPIWLSRANVQELEQIRWLKVDSSILMMQAAIHGLGFALAPIFQQQMNHGLVAPFRVASSIPGGVYLRSSAGFERPIVRKFREWLMEEVEISRRQIPLWAQQDTGLEF